MCRIVSADVVEARDESMLLRPYIYHEKRFSTLVSCDSRHDTSISTTAGIFRNQYLPRDTDYPITHGYSVFCFLIRYFWH